MERSTIFKLLFVISVGIVVLISYFIKSDKHELDELDDDFLNIEQTFEDVAEFDADYNLEDGPYDGLEDAEVFGEETPEEELDEDYINGTDDEFNYQKYYAELYGEDVIEKVLQDAEMIMEFYFDGKISDAKLRDYFASSRQKEMGKTINKREYEKIIELDVFATEQVVEDEIVVGAIAETEQGIEHLNLIFIEEKDRLLVENIVLIWSH